MLCLNAYAGAAGMGPSQLAARCWGYAAQCLTIAQRLDDPSDKLTLIKMAQAWVTLAEQASRDAQDNEPPGGAC